MALCVLFLQFYQILLKFTDKKEAIRKPLGIAESAFGYCRLGSKTLYCSFAIEHV